MAPSPMTPTPTWTPTPTKAWKPTPQPKPAPTSKGNRAWLTGSRPSLFASPSGNIACLMTTSDVRCDIGQHDWVQRARDWLPDCQLSQGSTIVLESSGPRFGCVGDTLLGSSGGQMEEWAPAGTARVGGKPVLGYGMGLRVGRYTCRSDSSGVTCRVSDRWFFISKQDYRLT